MKARLVVEDGAALRAADAAGGRRGAFSGRAQWGAARLEALRLLVEAGRGREELLEEVDCGWARDAAGGQRVVEEAAVVLGGALLLLWRP